MPLLMVSVLVYSSGVLVFIEKICFDQVFLSKKKIFSDFLHMSGMDRQEKK